MSEPSRLEGAMTIAEMVNASAVTQALYAAVRLGIPDHLAAGHRTTPELASLAGCDAALLHRLLRTLAAAGVCSEHEDGTFALTDLGHTLRRDVEGSMRAIVLHWAGPMWPVWGRLFHTVKTGRNPRALVTKQDAFASLGQHTEADRIFNDAMTEMSALVAQSVAAQVTIAEGARLCDVGGGHGMLIGTLLAAHPTCTGILFDRPQVVDGAAARLAAAGVSDRCDIVAGSFFEALPTGADVYLLKSVLHDWDDEQAGAILDRVHDAMPATGRLLIVERVLPDVMTAGARNRFVAASDLLMMLAAGGQERTAGAYRQLLARHGFRLASCTDTSAHYSVIEAARE